MEENAAKKLYAALKKISEQKKRDTMIIGTVTSMNPLKIDIGNNVELTSDFLYLGQMCRPHKVTMPHTHIIDTHFTGVSPSIGSIGFGISGTSFENAQATAAQTKINQYSTLDDEGKETQAQISDADLGRGKVQTSILAQAVTDNSVMITDNGHKHIIARHATKNVHIANGENADFVILDIQPKLQIGDKVLMFAFNDFQMFYVAERIEAE